MNIKPTSASVVVLDLEDVPCRSVSLDLLHLAIGTQHLELVDVHSGQSLRRATAELGGSNLLNEFHEVHLWPTADDVTTRVDVRFWPKTDVAQFENDVCS